MLGTQVLTLLASRNWDRSASCALWPASRTTALPSAPGLTDTSYLPRSPVCVPQGTCSCPSCSLQARDSNFGLKSLTLLPHHQGTLCSFLSCSDFLMSSSFQLPVPNSNLLTRCRHRMLCFGLWALDCISLYLHGRS